MANGRMVSRSIAVCEQLANVSLAADFLFGRCIPFTDAEGRMRGSAWDLKTQVVPKRREITVEVIPQLIDELANALDHDGQPLVERYEVGGEVFLFFPGHWRHQKIRMGKKGEGPSRLPAPPSARRETPQRSTPGVSPRGSPPGSTPGSNPDKGSTSLRSFDLSKSENGENLARARDLPPEVAPFLQRFYANAAPHRRIQVLEQLRRALSPEGCMVDRTTRAYATSLTLGRAIGETLTTDVRHPDRAIVVVLRKLVRGKCNEIDPPGRREGVDVKRDDAPSREREATRRPAAPQALGAVVEREASLQWVREDPARLAEIEARVDAGMASLHPRWTQVSWCVGVRAQRIEQAILAAFRESTGDTRPVPIERVARPQLQEAG